MKKIALELQPCVKQRSGIGMYTYELAKRLKNDTSIEYTGNIMDFCDIHKSKNHMKDINFKLSINKIISYSVYRRVWDYIPLSYNHMFSQKNDVFHFFNYIVPPKIKGKIITTIHDMTYKVYPETLDPKNLKRIQNYIEYSVSRSDYIVTISESSKRDIIREFNISEDKIIIISPSYSINAEKLKSKDINKKFNVNSPYILYVGNLEPRKNIKNLIESFSLLKKSHAINHKLVITGGKGWMYEEIFEIVNKLNISSEVIFTGFISDSEKTALYKYADLFVFPSLYEGFGIPILEAMAMGTPVVCSNTSSMPEVGGDAAFYIDPLDIESIANGIESVIHNENLRKSMIEKGYEQIKKFSWDESAEKLKTLYKTI